MNEALSSSFGNNILLHGTEHQSIIYNLKN